MVKKTVPPQEVHHVTQYGVWHDKARGYLAMWGPEFAVPSSDNEFMKARYMHGLQPEEAAREYMAHLIGGS